METFSSWPLVLILIIGLLVLLLPVLALIDIVKRGVVGPVKLLWIIIILLVPVLGSILYFLMRPAGGERG